MASISIPSTPAPKLKALTPTTDPNVAYQELAPQYANELSAIAQEEKQLGQTRSTTLTQLGQDKTTNLTALDQAKMNAFKNYGYSANARGVLFSGFQPYAQNQYTTTVYKPGVNKVNTAYTRGVGAANANFNTSMISLKDKLAQLNLQRIGEAQQLVLNSGAALASGGGGSGGGGSSGGGGYRSSGGGGGVGSFSGTPTNQKLSAALRTYIESKNLIGGDGHVAPSTLAAMYRVWKDNGLTDTAFWKSFQGLWNPNQGNYGAQFNAARR